MDLNEPTARGILEAAHAAWSSQDIESMLSWYHDDLTYFCNMGGVGGEPLRLYGKPDMRAFLQPVIEVADSLSVPSSFTYRDGVGRAQVEVFIRHRQTGSVLEGTYRQVVLFDGFKIKALEEFHDAAKMQAFWQMVLTPVDPSAQQPPTLARLLSNTIRPQQPPSPIEPCD